MFSLHIYFFFLFGLLFSITGIACKYSDHELMYVVNGHDSAPGDWPWMVYIYGPINLFERGYICGGVLVNDQWVLTAAHCLFKFGKYEPNFEVSDTKMVFLKHQFTTRSSEEMWISAAEHHEHPGFHGNVSKPSYSPSYDVALVKLSIKLDLGGKHSKLRPVRLPISGHKMSHHDCTITGWGLTDAETMSRPWDLVLQEATVAILPHAECDQRLSDEGGLSEEKMCTVLVDGKGNGCNGDSGGPVQCRIEENGHDIWVLEGIVSGGLLCGSTVHPVISTRVSSILDWISATINEQH